jgi:hypothetical protein
MSGKMKKISLIIVALSFILCQAFAQDLRNSNSGPIPKSTFEKATSLFEKNQNVETIGYAYAFQMEYTLSIPATCGFSLMTPELIWYLSSMCMGGDGNYYATRINDPSLFQLDTLNGHWIYLGNITGILIGETPTGIAYNTKNGTYYICTDLAFYSFDVTTRAAQYIGPFNTGGIMIDLCFDANGTCYSYDIETDKAYKINISTGSVTLLGPLGYDAQFGQGMSYDYQTNTIYLSAFNISTNTGQCRIMDPLTGMTTLITDWGYEQIDAFALAFDLATLCPAGVASNPNPPNGATDVSIFGRTLHWTNGGGTANVELWFGSVGSMTKIYDGPAVTSYALPTLDYNTNYQWRIACKNDTCTTWGPTWSFTTMEDPNLIYETIDVYPLNMNYWTGTCNSSTKTEVSLVSTINPELGWMVFDLSSIFHTQAIVINEIVFNGYLYANNWPYWSITPMGTVNPITGTASEIYNQVSNNYQQGVAYSFNQESGTLTNGWIERTLGASANEDLKNSLALNWFAIGMVEWDFNASYYVEFQGWAEANEPYLTVTYGYCLSCLPPNPPSNLAGQVIFNPSPQVQLNWQDNSNDEYGFKIYRKNGYPNDPGDSTFIGTTYSNVTQFIDTSVLPGSIYTYRVFSYDAFFQSGSNTTTISVPLPVELISFNANVENDVVTLSWQTATETNNSGFEIERTSPFPSPYQGEGGEAGRGWERIGFVEGKGTTTEIQSYSFIDKPEPGKYKYRLKQIDFDGSFEYSQEIDVEVKAPNVFSLEQNYPNPFNPSTKIKYSIPTVVANDVKQSQLVTLKVYDILGNEVAELINEEQAPGVYEVEFNSESSFRLTLNLPTGIYFYQLRAGSFVETKKMILLK